MLGSEQTLESVLDDFYDMKTENDDLDVIPDDDYSRFMNQIQTGLNVNVLDCKKMHIGVHALNGVQRMMRYLPKLVKIDFYDNLIRDSGLKSVLNILLANRSITHIDLGCNDLGDGCALVLSDIIRKTPLKSLQLGRREMVWQANKLNADCVFTVLNTIIETNKLECLGLAGIIEPKSKKGLNRITTSELIANVIKKCTKLSTLNLSYDSLTEEDQELLENGFSVNEHLRHLTLVGNSFPKSSAIADGIVSISTLRYLDLSNCMLSSRSCNIIADAFESGWEVIQLNLSENPIGSSGIARLFDSIRYNNTLVSLKVSHVGFDVSAVESIEACIKCNVVLDFLDLSKNFASDELAYAFAETIGENDTIRFLNLSSCKITDSGAIALCNSLCYNKSLKKLVISDNFISTDGCFEMVNILQPNEVIRSLDVTSNKVDIFALEAVATYCKRNQISSNDKTLMPLRREYVRLSIEKSKIPRVKQYLDKEKVHLEEIQGKLLNLDTEKDIYDERTSDDLKSLYNSTEEFNALIREQVEGINDLEKQREELENDQSIRFKEIQGGIDADVAVRTKVEKEAEAIENRTKEILESLESKEDMLKKEIDVLKQLIAEVESQTDTKEKTLKYKVPPMPDDEAIRKMALGEVPLFQKPPAPKISKKKSAKNFTPPRTANMSPRSQTQQAQKRKPQSLLGKK